MRPAVVRHDLLRVAGPANEVVGLVVKPVRDLGLEGDAVQQRPNPYLGTVGAADLMAGAAAKPFDGGLEQTDCCDAPSRRRQDMARQTVQHRRPEQQRAEKEAQMLDRTPSVRA
jgi:hypothetical protein